MGPFDNQTLQLSQVGCLGNRPRGSFAHRKFIKDALRINICREGRAAGLGEVALGCRCDQGLSWSYNRKLWSWYMGKVWPWRGRSLQPRVTPEKDFPYPNSILPTTLLITFWFLLCSSSRERMSHIGTWGKSGLPKSFIFVLVFTPISFQKRIWGGNGE